MDDYNFLNIPDSCFIGSTIYKKLFYENANLSPSDKYLFTDIINKIVWLYCVTANPKCPKADGVACPRFDEYNDRILGKEKDDPHHVYLLAQVHRSHPHTKHDHCIKL